MMGYDKLSPVRGYWLLIALRFISSTVVWLDFVSIYSNINYYWHATPFQIGVTSALYGLPGLVLGPFIGRVTDGGGPYRVLGLSYFFRGLSSVLLFTAPSIELFIAAAFIKGISNLGAMPAEQLLIKSMLNNEQIVSNAGIMTALDQIVKILSPLVISLLALWYAPNIGFVLSFGMALIGLIVAAMLRVRHPFEPAVGAAPTTRENAAALRDLISDNFVFRYGLMASLLQAFMLGLYDPMLTVALKEQGHGAESFGLVVSATACGALLGALLFKRVFGRKGSFRLVSLSLLGFGMSVFLPGILGYMNLKVPLSMFIGLWVINGMCYALTAMNFGVILQTQTPISHIGTVSATIRSAQLSLLVTAPLVGSFFAARLGVELLFAVCGAVTIAFSGVFALRHSNTVVSAPGRV